jgi:hypothetical protein
MPKNHAEPAQALFRVRAENGEAVSLWSEVATGAGVRVSGSCQAGFTPPDVLCLQDGRFEVRAYWRVTLADGFETDGRGMAAPFDFSDDSGTFWFFDPNNVELVVKMLDARVINDSFWTFFGALSDVEYWIVVTDTVEDTNVTYYNPRRAVRAGRHGLLSTSQLVESTGPGNSAAYFPADSRRGGGKMAASFPEPPGDTASGRPGGLHPRPGRPVSHR